MGRLGLDAFPLGAIRWDGYGSPNAPGWANTAGFPGLKANFEHRQPRHWAPNFALYSNDVGTVIDTQSIVDAEILDACTALDYWMWNWYPEASELGADVTEASQITQVFNCYLASQYKGRIKFALNLAATWLGWPNNSFAHATAIYARIAALVQDPQHLRIGGKPVLFLYEVWDSTNMPSAQWTAFKAAIGEPIIAVSSSRSTSTMTTYSMQAMTAYGPNPSLPAGSSRLTFAAWAATDKTNFNAAPGGLAAASFAGVLDRRPIGSTDYVDLPTQPEWQRQIRAAIDFNQAGVGGPLLGLIYSHSEVAEGGPFNSIQETSPTTGKSRFYDGIEWERHKSVPPTSYTYEVSASNVGGAVAHTGTWVTEEPGVGSFGAHGVDGAHESDEETSSTAGSTITFTHEGLASVDITGTTGQAVGQFSVAIDGGAPVMVDPYVNSATVRHATLWSSGALGGGTHTITVTVLNAKNAGSSSTQVRIDTFRSTYNPRLI